MNETQATDDATEYHKLMQYMKNQNLFCTERGQENISIFSQPIFIADRQGNKKHFDYYYFFLN